MIKHNTLPSLSLPSQRLESRDGSLDTPVEWGRHHSFRHRMGFQLLGIGEEVRETVGLFDTVGCQLRAGQLGSVRREEDGDCEMRTECGQDN